MANLRRAGASFTDPGIKCSVQEAALKSYKAQIQIAKTKNPFAHTEEAADFLEKMGIPTDPFAVAPHPHGADKALENHVLEQAGLRLPWLGKGPYTFMQMKPGKLGLFRRARHDKDQFLNWAHEPRDLTRFAEPALFTRLADLHVENSIAFMSDTLHFLTPKAVLQLFLAQPVLQDLLATVVLPIEATRRMASLHPEIYSLEYDKEGFFYYPGGHAGSGYYHPTSTLQWLDTGVIIGGGIRLTLDKIESCGAHHLFHITRSPLEQPSRFMYEVTRVATVPELFYPAGQPARPYDVGFLNRMFMYCQSVKTVSLRDIFAKMRQVIPSKEIHLYEPSDLTCLANFFLYVAALNNISDYSTVKGLSWLGEASVRVRECVRPMVESMFGESEYAQLLALTRWNLVPLNMTPRVVECWFVREAVIVHEPAGPDDKDPPAGPPSGGSGPPGGGTLPPPGFPPHPPSGPPGAGGPSPPNGLVSPERETMRSNLPLGAPLSPPASALPAPTAFMHGEPDAVDSAAREYLGQGRYDAVDTAILESCGFYEQTVQHDQSGADIPMITKNPNPVENIEFEHQYLQPLHAKLTSLHRHTKSYQVDNVRASAFASDSKKQRVGLLIPKQPMEWLKGFSRRCNVSEFTTALTVIHGAGGSGKSMAIQTMLNEDVDIARFTTVVCPTNELRMDWLGKLEHVPFDQVKTFENALVQQDCNDLVVFDDYSKLPNGFIDAFLVMHQNVDWVILTGDSRQSVYHCNNTEAQVAHIDDNVTWFMKYCDYYLNATHRQPRNFANWVSVHASRADKGYVNFAPAVTGDTPVLVPSTVARNTLADIGRGRKAYTYSGCQGLTRRDITIVLNNDTPSCSDQVVFTALTRSSHSITFVNSYSHSDAFEAKIQSTPYLKAFISGVWEDEQAGRDQQAREEPPTEPEMVKTHLPVEHEGILFEDVIEAQGEKYDREVLVAGTGYTNAIQSEDEFVQMMPHQQARDEALMAETMSKRLIVSTAEANTAAFNGTRVVGDFLFEAYQQAMCLPETSNGLEFDEDLWLTCGAEVERTYLSKPVANLMNGELRQSPDFDEHAISLFLKSQWVKKEEKLGLPVKAGQTIAAFMQEVVMIYGQAARYMRRVRERYQPKNIFIMCEKTPDQLDGFVRDNWSFKQPAFTSDYTMYDASQDGAFLNFEVRKMRYHNLPARVVDGYIAIKTHAKVFLGVLAIMRLSGEGPTFDANTECNIAYDHLKYDIPRNSASMYAGDDLARDQEAPLRPTWADMEPLFTLKAKPCVTERPDFCSWRLTKHGVVQNPRKLYAALKVGMRLGKIDALVPSYSLNFMYAYKLGDAVFEVFDEEDMKYHQATVRLMHKIGVHPSAAGDHFPAYHIRSDHLLDRTHVDARKAEKWLAEQQCFARAARNVKLTTAKAESFFGLPGGFLERQRVANALAGRT